MALTLSLYRDDLEAGAELDAPAAAHRAVYVVRGGLRVGPDALGADDAAYVAAGTPVAAGDEPATLWRWDVTGAGEPAGNGSPLLLAAPLDATRDPDREWLLRCDSVAFPPGGCAYSHTHRGPGIRCLLEGRIRIDTGGASHHYAPGEAWFEAGPEPVFARADRREATRFIRVMLLPLDLLGKSSIRYVDPADADKPKTQRYRVYVDRPLAA